MDCSLIRSNTVPVVQNVKLRYTVKTIIFGYHLEKYVTSIHNLHYVSYATYTLVIDLKIAIYPIKFEQCDNVLT